MPVHTRYAQKIDYKGPPPSWHLRERWRCEVALGPRGGAAEGCLRRRSAALYLPVSLSHTVTPGTLPEDGQDMAYASSCTFYNELLVAPEQYPVLLKSA